MTLSLILKDIYITLIPKKPNPSQAQDYRLISLCNTVYKISAKNIANRLWSIMPTLISPTQGTFIPGGDIVDNLLLSQEIRNFILYASRSKSFMTIKLDMEKAFDRLD